MEKLGDSKKHLPGQRSIQLCKVVFDSRREAGQDEDEDDLGEISLYSSVSYRCGLRFVLHLLS